VLNICDIFDDLFSKLETIMGQATVLTDTEIRRVFRILETTRHIDRNRLAFVLSIYAGLRVGEIASLTVGDASTQNGDVRREIKLKANQTKGSKGRTVILSDRVRREIGSFLKHQPKRDQPAPLIASQCNGRPFTNVTLSMLFKEIYESAGIRTSSHSGRRTFATRLNEKGVGMRTIQKLMGHRHIGTTAAYCDVSDETMRNAVELV
jgi:integrase/recombinase XerD